MTLLLLAVVKWILALVLIVHNHHRQRASYFLSAGLVVLSMYDINHYFTLGNGSREALAIIYNHCAPILQLTSPLFLIYVRSTLADNERFSRSDWLHLIPAAIVIIDLWPYWQLSVPEKLDYASKILSDLNAVRELSNHLFLNHFLMNLLRAGTSLIYFSWCLYLIWRYRNNIPNHPEVPRRQRQITLRWMTVLMGTLTIISFNYVLLVFEFRNKSLSPALFDNSTFFLAILLFYVIMSVSLLFFPEILYGLPRAVSSFRSNEQYLSTEHYERGRVSPRSEANQSNANSHHSFLHSDDADPFAGLSHAIVQHLKEDKPYLNPQFSITDLSIRFGVPPHHIAYCFSTIIGEKFTDNRKRLRVEKAQKQLLTHDQYSIDGIGKECGFASKSSFYNSFKDVTGQTPLEFLKSKKTV